MKGEKGFILDRRIKRIGDPSPKRIEALLTLLDRLISRDHAEPGFLIRFRELYSTIPEDDKPAFFERFVAHLEIKKQDITDDILSVMEFDEQDPARWSQVLGRLRGKLESHRRQALKRFINMPGGFKFLLELRADVLTALRKGSAAMVPLTEEIAQLFDFWFQEGFLYLQEITQNSSYRLVRFLKDHDLVHPMMSLDQMGDRMGKDRRCFALFHRAMPEEPAVFTEVALTRGMPKSIQDIIGESEGSRGGKRTVDTAIFYSINNAQNGLTGMGLGRILIFQVMEELRRSRPGLKTFASLSPIPGFWPRYLKLIFEGNVVPFMLQSDHVEAYFSKGQRRALLDRCIELNMDTTSSMPSALLAVLSDPAWIEDPVFPGMLKNALTKIAYFYITQEKNDHGRPLNPVAGFHLGNGAMVSPKNIHFGANPTPRGLEESCGLMVNYLYSRTWLQQLALTLRSLLPWRSSSSHE